MNISPHPHWQTGVVCLIGTLISPVIPSGVCKSGRLVIIITNTIRFIDNSGAQDIQLVWINALANKEHEVGIGREQNELGFKPLGLRRIKIATLQVTSV